MHLAYFEENQTTYLPLNTKLTSFSKKIRISWKIWIYPTEYKENLLHNLDLVKDYPTKFENLKKIIDNFQKILDSSVERLFLAIE